MIKIKFHTQILALILIFAFFGLGTLSAQENFNSTKLDSISYMQYMKKDWQGIIDLNTKYGNVDDNSYYFNYRVGVAYYSEKKYRKAIKYFTVVSEISKEDPIIKEYLYYSYLFGAQIIDAKRVLNSMDRSLIEHVGFYNYESIFNGVSAEYKYFVFDDYKAVDFDKFTKQKIRKNMSYLSTGLLNYTEGNTDYYYNFSYLTGQNSVYDKSFSPNVIEEVLNQYQFYFSLNKSLFYGGKLKASFTYMNEVVDWKYMSYNVVKSGGDKSSKYTGTNKNMVGYLSFNHNYANVEYSVASSFSKINKEYQVQPEFAFAYYPFSNKVFYSTTTLMYQYNFKKSVDQAYVIKQKLSSELGSFNIDLFAQYGDVKNMVDDEGMSIYNAVDEINYWYGLNANYRLGKFDIYLQFKNTAQTNNYTQKRDNKSVNYNIKSALIGVNFNI